MQAWSGQSQTSVPSLDPGPSTTVQVDDTGDTACQVAGSPNSPGTACQAAGASNSPARSASRGFGLPVQQSEISLAVWILSFLPITSSSPGALLGGCVEIAEILT